MEDNIDDYGINRDKYIDSDIYYRNGHYFYNYRLVAEKILNKRYITLYRWYQWFKEQDKETKKEYYLPPMYKIYTGYGEIKFGNANQYLNCIKYEDIPVIIEFSEKAYFGMMAQYNRSNSWGKAGEEIRKRNGSKTKGNK